MLSLLFSRGGGSQKSIGDLVIDVFSEEDITYASTVTDHPIETGEAVTDHVFNQPTRLRVRGTIAGNRGGGGFFNIGGIGGDRKQEGYETLRELHQARQPLDVVTGLEVFTNMVITDLSIPRTARTGGALVFDVEFKQVRFVDSQRADLGDTASEDSADLASSTSNAGRQSAVEASPENAQAAESVAERSQPQSLLRSFF